MRTLGLILIVILFLGLWDVAWWKIGDVQPYGAWTLKKMLDDNENITVLDVRTPGEFQAFHIPGAVNVPYPASLNDLARIIPNPNQAIIVVCMTGHRSPPVIRQLQKGGYTNVANLTWGMAAWKIFGGETISKR